MSDKPQSEREKLVERVREMSRVPLRPQGEVYTISLKIAGELADFIIQEKASLLTKGIEMVLNDLQRTYPLIREPIPQSPMELTEEAKVYNKVVADLDLFIMHWRRKLAALTPKTTKEES